MNRIQEIVLKTDKTKWKIVIEEATSGYLAGLWIAPTPQEGYLRSNPDDIQKDHKTPQDAFVYMARIAMQKEKKTPVISNPLGDTFLSDEEIGRILESL